MQLAEELGIPFLPQLLACMQNDFEQHYYQCCYLMKEPEYRETVVDLFRSNLPLSEMTGELSNDAGLGKDFLKYTQLDFILQELRSIPLLGTDLVMTGLKSPVVRCRNRAMSVLKQWTEITGKPLSQLSEDLFEIVKALKETRDEPMELIDQLLDGNVLQI